MELASNDRARILSRFFSKVNKTDSCWLWTGASVVGSDGKMPRGVFWLRDATVLAHRASYELFVGPIQPGLTIDHVAARGCASTLCVNPAHLEAVTNRENVLRGSGPTAKNARKERCHRGHPFTPDNTLRHRLGRGCRRCAYARRARRAERVPVARKRRSHAR